MHVCLSNNRAPLSLPLLPIQQSRCPFDAPTQPPYSRSCFTPQHAQASCGAPTQPPVSGVGVCTHSCVPFPRLPKATSASQTIALLLHAHLRLPNNREPLSWPLLLLFHSHFCLPNNRATLRRRFDLPNNHAILRRANSPTEFTLTYMPQNTLASLFATPSHPPYTHFCLPHDCSAMSVSQQPPNTLALLAHDRFCVCPVIQSLSDKLT
jgi:hypothetical protein